MNLSDFLTESTSTALVLFIFVLFIFVLFIFIWLLYTYAPYISQIIANEMKRSKLDVFLAGRDTR